jgi:hypothetical protein
VLRWVPVSLRRTQRHFDEAASLMVAALRVSFSFRLLSKYFFGFLPGSLCAVYVSMVSLHDCTARRHIPQFVSLWRVSTKQRSVRIIVFSSTNRCLLANRLVHFWFCVFNFTFSSNAFRFVYKTKNCLFRHS